MPPNAHSISVAANTIHRAVLHTDPLAALSASRWSLEGTSDFWAFVLQIATVAITLGVFVEVVATILEIIEDRAEGKKLPLHAILTLLGGGVVAIALGFEFWAEFKTASIETDLRKNNAAAQGELDKRARDATAEAVAIANKFGGLQNFVAHKEGEMDSAFSSFKTFAEQQQTRTTNAINGLNTKQAKLQTALSSVDASAGKAASAADTAGKTSASMTDTLNSERQMQGQMRAIITHRVLTPEQAAGLVEKLKPFAKTPFDLFLMQDPDAMNFEFQLADVLQKAGWDWKPAPALGALVFTPPGKPQIGMQTLSGCSIEIAESSRSTLTAPVLALLNGILGTGIPCRASANKDADMKSEFDKKWVHIFVGIRD